MQVTVCSASAECTFSVRVGYIVYVIQDRTFFHLNKIEVDIIFSFTFNVGLL